MEVNIFTFIALILSFLGLSWFAGTDAPYVRTKQYKIKDALKESDLKADQNFYELGSGDGRVVLEAAKFGANSYGIEQSWIRIWMSRFSARHMGLKNTHFLHGNVFDRNYYPADVVFIYLLQPAVDRLEEKLQIELKPGAKVITQTYHFKNWKPYKQVGNFWYYKKDKTKKH